MMRAEWRCLVVGAVALGFGALGVDRYATIMAPYYVAVASATARFEPWEISGIGIGAESRDRGTVIRLSGIARASRAASAPAALVVGRLHAGAALQVPLVLFGVVLIWPAASRRERLAAVAAAVPILLLLEAGGSALQLLAGFADASRALAGNAGGTPGALELWSRLLEGGGRIALTSAGAMAAVAIGRWLHPGVGAAAAITTRG